MNLLKCDASLIWKLVPFGSIMFALLESSIKFALSEPSIKFVVPYMVLTLTFVNVKSIKYLLSQRIVCVVVQSTRHTSLSFILRSITHGFQIKLIKTRDNINSNAIDVITK